VFLVLSELSVGWLLLLAAVATFAGGIGLRVFVGRRRKTTVGRVVRSLRESTVGAVLYGPVANDALDDEELDQTFLMPTIVVFCGLALTAFFLLGYALVT
jgi:uncharacterized membrane protein